MSIHPLGAYFEQNRGRDLNSQRYQLREIIQKICLLGLWRGSFFEHAAFYGGTALRLMHGLDRWSEDLDFSLLLPKQDFRLESYLDFVSRELEAWGIKARVEISIKQNSNIETAFIKANTLESLTRLDLSPLALKSLHRDEISSVKFEVDPHPPCEFASESLYILDPIPISVRVMGLPDLFAGKMHALLARGWQSRVKGRDWYDLIWFVRSDVELNLSHLEARLRQSGHFTASEALTVRDFRNLLRGRIDQVDFAQAVQDVQPFVPNPQALQSWSKELFEALVDRIRFSGN
jgi:predicted nucleotidyltransferase component of viral defense system